VTVRDFRKRHTVLDVDDGCLAGLLKAMARWRPSSAFLTRRTAETKKRDICTNRTICGLFTTSQAR